LEWEALWAFKDFLLGSSMPVAVGIELDSWRANVWAFVCCCGAVPEAEKIVTAVAEVFPS
jgi:hypothetical protein